MTEENHSATLRIAPRVDRFSIGANVAAVMLSVGVIVIIEMAALFRLAGVIGACVTLPVVAGMLIGRACSIRLDLLGSGFYVANYFRRRARPWTDLRKVSVIVVTGNRILTTLGALRFHTKSGRISARASVRMTSEELRQVRAACLDHGVIWSVDARDLRLREPKRV